MESTTLDQLRDQERTLCEQIALLEETAAASSTPGIREFRMTRLRQLDDQRVALGDRLRRLASCAEPAIEAYVLGTAFRDVTRMAQGTFGN